MQAKYIYVIGDIHGCYTELLELEKKVYAHAEAHGVEPFFVSVGDLIDRGPDSLSVVRHVREGVEACRYAAIAGNHEACLFESLYPFLPEAFSDRGFLDSGTIPRYMIDLREQYRYERLPGMVPEQEYVEGLRASWLRQGGAETLKSFGSDPDDVSTWTHAREELIFLSGLPLLWENDRIVVTHALATKDALEYARSVHKRKPVSFQPVPMEQKHNIHALIWSRDLPDSPIEPGKIHVSGHTPLDEPFQLSALKCVMLDTGCVFGNRLTAWCTETGEFFSVQARTHRRF